ncbi:MAG: hypothetical protein J6U98_04125 [Abditibacteriota bacterium]|nr:hypothetical protein [Abditibacteriota bacterium]
MKRLAALLLLLLSAPAYPKTAVVLAPCAPTNILLSSPAMSSFLKSSSAGIMNVKTGKTPKDTERWAAALTFGSGKPAIGEEGFMPASPEDTLEGGITAEEFRSFTVGGKTAGEVVAPSVISLRRRNETSGYRAMPGALGKLLSANNVKRTFIGNCDTLSEKHREDVAACFDDSGCVDFGTVSDPNLLIKDPASPCGLKTNIDFTVAEAEKYFAESGLVVIDFGDFARLARIAPDCAPKRAETVAKKISADLAELLEKTDSLLDEGDTLMLAVHALPNDETGELLGLLAVKGPGFEKGGLLYSPSTRRKGVVTLNDCAPTVAKTFGTEDGSFSGRPLTSVKSGDSAKFLRAANREAKLQAENRAVMRFSAFAQMFLMIIAAVSLLCGFKYRDKIKNTALLPPVMALTLLWLPKIITAGAVLSGTVFAALSLALLFVLLKVCGSFLRALFVVSVAIICSVAFDLVFLRQLLASSPGGYYITVGGRYYGIGNEFMGSMLGAAAVVIACAAGRLKRKSAGVLFSGALSAAVFVLIGLSVFGANVGGSIAAAVFGTAATLTLSGFKPSKKLFALGGVICLLLIAFVFAFDALRGSGSRSHAGMLASAAAHGNRGEVFGVFLRKFTANMRLSLVSPWTKVVIAGALCSAALRKKAGTLSLPMKSALCATVVGSVAAFLFNDSGIIAAGTCLVFTFALICAAVPKEE